MTRSDAKLEAASAVVRRPDLAGVPGRVGQWELVRLVGEGSLTKVYRARPAGSPADRPAAYALKMLRPARQRDPQAIQLLRREALVGREVTHPHLIAVLAADLSRPPYFVVMPWLDGTTLARRLIDQPGLAPPVALWIARQVAEALDALHAAGWMHGDVKPTNIFLSPDGHVTLLDLGFARRPGEGGSAVERCVTGTSSYMAPEMITSAWGADTGCDVYSLGVVLFEMLSGRLPFAGSDLAELAAEHRQARPPDLRRLVPHLPGSVTRLVRQMLAKMPLRRPQTPEELIERLAALEIETFAERAID
jgi:serine/threonine protein kinase